MKIMNSSKEPEEQQQSYFYVVWPEAEDKSPGAEDKSPGASSVAATTSSAEAAVVNSIPSAAASTDLPTFSYESRALSTSSTNDTAISSLQPKSPVTSPQRTSPQRRSQRSPLMKDEMASVQVITSDNTSGNLSSTKSGSDEYSVPGTQHVAATVPCNLAAFPSLDSYNASSSLQRRHKTAVTPDYSPAKPRFHRSGAGSSVGESTTLKEIGALAKQAILNLQKIVLVSGSPGSGTSPVTPNNRDPPAAKRRRVWDQATSSESCMECEVKDAEINILRRRILKMQEQLDQVTSPNGNDTVQSRPPSPEEERVSPFKPLQLSETPPPPPLEEQPLVLQQQQQPTAGKPPKVASVVVVPSDTQTIEQSSSVKQEYVELVSGSGVYIQAYKLEDATRDAKTGTQLARKLMDAFWDKDTLAKSTLTPRSKFQYQQLDPTVIKSIEAYCLYHDNTLHSKDIHATMTDKCCQARSKYRSLNPQMYTAE